MVFSSSSPSPSFSEMASGFSIEISPFLALDLSVPVEELESESSASSFSSPPMLSSESEDFLAAVLAGVTLEPELYPSSPSTGSSFSSPPIEFSEPPSLAVGNVLSSFGMPL